MRKMEKQSRTSLKVVENHKEGTPAKSCSEVFGEVIAAVKGACVFTS